MNHLPRHHCAGSAAAVSFAVLRRAGIAASLAAAALLIQGCGLFGGGTPPCEKPQMYQAAEASAPLVAPEGLETPQAFGNLEIPEGRLLEGQPRRGNGSCLEEPPQIKRPGEG